MREIRGRANRGSKEGSPKLGWWKNSYERWNPECNKKTLLNIIGARTKKRWNDDRNIGKWRNAVTSPLTIS